MYYVSKGVVIGALQSHTSHDHTFGSTFRLVVKGLCWRAQVPGSCLVVGKITHLKNGGAERANANKQGMMTVPAHLESPCS